MRRHAEANGQPCFESAMGTPFHGHGSLSPFSGCCVHTCVTRPGQSPCVAVRVLSGADDSAPGVPGSLWQLRMCQSLYAVSALLPPLAAIEDDGHVVEPI